MFRAGFISRRQVSGPPPNTNTLGAGLVMYLKMNEASGSSIADATGNGHVATADGASVSNLGILGNCRDLAGSGKITIPGDFSDFSSEAYSVALWVRMNPDGSERGLICHEGGFAAYGWRIAYSISVQGILSLVHNGVGEHDSPEAVDLTGSWHRIFVTYAASSSKLYVDGTLLSTATLGPRISAVGAGELINIGCLSPISFFQFGYFPGLIDEVGYWNQEVSESDVIADWNDGSGLAFEDFGS